MTERYLFFNSTAVDPRIYQAEDMATYWGSYLTNGVIGLDAFNTLEVSADGSTMNLTLSPGRAQIQGHLYINDAPLTLTVAQATGTNRIDRLVLRFDNSLPNRYIRAFIKEGNGNAPTLQRDANIYEISLARFTVTAGQSFISQSDIIDERSDQSVCGFSTILASRADANQISLTDNLQVLRSNNVDDGVYESILLPSKLSTFRSQLDSRGVFRLVENRRTDGTLARVLELSNPDAAGNYLTQTIRIYEANGTTLHSTEVWTITYDNNGNVIGEVLN